MVYDAHICSTCPSLEVLNCNHNAIRSLPSSFGPPMAALHTFSISHNPILMAMQKQEEREARKYRESLSNQEEEEKKQEEKKQEEKEVFFPTYLQRLQTKVSTHTLFPLNVTCY